MIISVKYFRIKGLCVCPSLDEDDNCKKWLCVCSSDGHIKIYRILESGVGIHSSELPLKAD